MSEVGVHYATLLQDIKLKALAELEGAMRRGRRSPEAWRDAVQALALRLLAFQVAGATYADAYLNDVLDAQDADPLAEAQVNPAAFSDLTDGGGSWLQALVFAPNSVRLPGIEWWTRFQFVANSIVVTGLNDVARGAVQSGMQARPAVAGYVRMLKGKSCARCAILAGRRYKSAVAFRRHKRCFPSGVLVSGPGTLSAARRWYDGELAVLTTASGQQLALTGNHPVLTRRGWVPANLLHEGDEVVRSTRAEGATSLVVPDHDQVPALIEDVWGSLAVTGSTRMPTTAEDFHGDGQHGEVEIVGADSALGRWDLATLGQQAGQVDLRFGNGRVVEFPSQGSAMLLDQWQASLSTGSVSCGGLVAALLFRQVAGPDVASFAQPSPMYTCVGQSLGHDAAGHAVLSRQSVLAGPGLVGGDYRFSRYLAGLSRWDPPGDAFTVETREGYAARGRDLLHRLAGQVQLDRVVELRRVHWSGHVYSLTSAEGWHVANSLIVSNCDCVHIPDTEDTGDDWTTNPRTYFRSLSREDQDRLFTKAGAEAIRLGADLSQVVNAQKGVSVVRAYGEDVLRTLEGTTKRGIAGQRLAAEGFSKTVGLKSSKYAYARTPRLLPDEIFLQAERLGWDRAEVLRQLRRFAYVL